MKKYFLKNEQISPSKSHTPTPNLIVESTSLLVNKKFSGFKSRWVTLTAVVMLLHHDHENVDYADPGCPNKKKFTICNLTRVCFLLARRSVQVLDVV